MERNRHKEDRPEMGLEGAMRRPRGTDPDKMGQGVHQGCECGGGIMG